MLNMIFVNKKCGIYVGKNMARGNPADYIHRKEVIEL